MPSMSKQTAGTSREGTSQEEGRGRLKRARIFRKKVLYPLLAFAAASLPDAALTAADRAEAPQPGGAVRACLFVPGASVPASMPADVARPAAMEHAPILAAPSPTATRTEQRQLQEQVLDGLTNAVRDHYLVADLRGRDW
jgi:hypothetical protein